MASNIPFVRGRNVRLKLFQDGKPVYVMTKNWDESHEATEAEDHVNGEDRARYDLVTNGFAFNCEVYQQDEEVMDAFMAAQDAEDAQGLPLKQSAAIQISHRDGTKAAYLLQECVFGPWKKSASGRSDNYMLSLKIRCRYYKRIPSI